MNEREAMAILVSAWEIDYVRRGALLRAAGSACALLMEPGAYGRYLGEQGLAALRRAMAGAEETLGGISRAGVQLLLPGDAGYPQLLVHIPRPPHLLYVQGASDLNAELSVAVVGTRKASEYGLRHTKEIARALAQAGVCVVSGLALGVDAAAHEGALDAQGRTIAVLGGGLDRFYPKENLSLRDRILSCGGSVVSEYPMGTKPEGERFLHRNRIIAGMCAGVVVTQGPHRSGAHRTACDAADYGREVFALPGSVEEPCSRLPHKLIGEGAHLIAGAKDVLAVLAPERIAKAERRAERSGRPLVRRAQAPQSAPAQEESRPARQWPQDLPEAALCVLHALEGGSMEFDALCEAAGISGSDMGALLMELELDGHIISLPGLSYRLEQ